MLYYMTINLGLEEDTLLVTRLLEKVSRSLDTGKIVCFFS